MEEILEQFDLKVTFL